MWVDMLDAIHKLFPAYAGVIPVTTGAAATPTAFPRTCGGDPNAITALTSAQNFSPHTRG